MRNVVIVLAIAAAFVAHMPQSALAQDGRRTAAVTTQQLVDRLVLERAAVLAAVQARANERELQLLRGLADRDRQIRATFVQHELDTRESNRLESELAQVNEQRMALTERLSRAYSFELDLREYRRQVVSIANSDDPRRRAALQRYADGDRTSALLVLTQIQEAETRAVAAGWREIGALALDMLDRGERTTTDVLPIYETAQRLDPSDHWGWIELSRLLQKAGRYRDAAGAAEAALTHARDDRSRGVALSELSTSLTSAGDTQGALMRMRESVEIARRVLIGEARDGDRYRDLEIALRRLGHQQFDAGLVSDARASYQEALQIAEELASENSGRPQQQDDLAGTLVALGRTTNDVSQARSYTRHALAVYERLNRAEPRSLQFLQGQAEAHGWLGTLELRLGNTRVAREQFEQGLAINRRVLASNPNDAHAARLLLGHLESLGSIAGTARDFQGARRYFVEMHALAQRALSSDPSGFLTLDAYARSLDNLARLSRAEAQTAEAQTYWLECLRVRQRLAAQVPDDARVQWDVVMAYGALGYMPGNERYLQEALNVAADLDRRGMLTSERRNTVRMLRERLTGTHE